ncbi:MAG: ATP-binding cassette domain-containing protein [Burkholderiales bacterium]|nr:ATP-binding cassette domain-containing protein [Burkholderiales bacterium]
MLALNAVRLQRAGQLFGPFDLSLAAGERVAVLGPSGAGKSTLLNLMSGGVRPDVGVLELQGERLDRLRPAERARRRAVLPQSHRLAFGLPVELVVSLGRWGRGDEARHIGPALAWAQASHLRDRRYDELSGGEQARVQLARVLAQLADVEGGLLLADEPLAALDPGLQLELLDLLQRFCAERGHALVAVLHDLQQALQGFERLWLMRAGRVLVDHPANSAALPLLGDLFGLRLQALELPEGGWALAARRAAA